MKKRIRNTLLSLLATAMLTTPAIKAESNATFNVTSNPTEFFSDVPGVKDGFQVGVSSDVKKANVSCVYQENENFLQGTDFSYCGVSADLPKGWHVIGGLRGIRLTDEVKEQTGATDVLKLFTFAGRKVKGVPVSVGIVYDTKSLEQNFGIIRGTFDRLPIGKIHLYGTTAMKFSDVGNMSDTLRRTDWVLGAGHEKGGLFVGTSAAPGYDGFAGFLKPNDDFGAFLYGKSTPEGGWFNLKWSTGDVRQEAFNADTAFFVGKVVNDAVLRPLFGDDELNYFENGSGLSGLVAGYTDAGKTYIVGELGGPTGNIGGKRPVSFYTGAGATLGLEGTETGLNVRQRVTIDNLLPGLTVNLDAAYEKGSFMGAVRGNVSW